MRLTRAQYETALGLLRAEAAAGRGEVEQSDYPATSDMPPYRYGVLAVRIPRADLATAMVPMVATQAETGGYLTSCILSDERAEIQVAISRDLEPDEIDAAQAAQTGGAS